MIGLVGNVVSVNEMILAKPPHVYNVTGVQCTRVNSGTGIKEFSLYKLTVQGVGLKNPRLGEGSQGCVLPHPDRVGGGRLVGPLLE